MNRRNDWKSALKYANEAIADTGKEIIVRQEEDGYWFVYIKTDDVTEVYAENYFEDELEDCINGIRHEICVKMWENKIFIVTYVGLSDNDNDGNGFCNARAFKTFGSARASMLRWIDDEKKNIEQMEEEYEIIDNNERLFHITWCGGDEQVKIEIQEVALL